jgi:hypothetical protein
MNKYGGKDAQCKDQWAPVNTLLNLRVPWKAGNSSVTEQLLSPEGLCNMYEIFASWLERKALYCKSSLQVC